MRPAHGGAWGEDRALEQPAAPQTWDIALASWYDVMNFPVFQVYHIFALDGPHDWVSEQPGGRIRGGRTDDGRVIYRPKHGLEGVIANVEVVIDHHVRVNVHVRP
jgi:hypothetical protein